MRKFFTLLFLTLIMFCMPVFAENNTKIDSSIISKEKIFIRTSGLSITDDGKYRLILQRPYEEGADGKELIVSNAAKRNVFIVDLYNGSQCNVYNKFVIAGYVNGKLTALSDAHYVTNPTALAKTTVKRKDNGKKGILLSAMYLSDRPTLSELNLDQGVYNVLLGSLFNDGSIPYEFEGKTYYFNKQQVDEYDFVVDSMKDLGIQATLILLNDRTSDLSMIHPDARGGNANYYAFNTAEEEGVNKLAAVIAFLSERYSGTDHGTVDNYIIGNEINARSWHYMDPSVTTDELIKEYVKSYRIAYASIKRNNPNARIYFSIDHNWEIGTAAATPGIDTIKKFNNEIVKGGMIDWELAIHPYNDPMTKVDTWSNSKTAKDYITMQNLSVLTDFMSSAEMLNEKGDVRSILLSEQGYTSSVAGEELQGMAIVYGYMRACENKYIDGYLLTRQQDAPEETVQNMYFGIMNYDGTRKTSFDWYKNADDQNLQYNIKSQTGW